MTNAETDEMTPSGPNNCLKNKIYRPDLCKEYAERIAALPSQLGIIDLEKYFDSFMYYPYIEALSLLKDSVFSHETCLNENRLSRIEKMVERIEKPHILQECADQRIQDEYCLRIVQQNESHIDLLCMMNKVPNCIKQEEKLEVARNIQTDIYLGACTKLFGIDKNKFPQMYLRHYIGLDRSSAPVLQIDAVEGGTESYWTTVQQWVDAGRGKELLYCLSASLYLADNLGIQKVVLGDFESDEIGKLIGCRDELIYDHDVFKRKIGLPPRIENDSGKVVSEGVFVNRLVESSCQRVFNIHSYREISVFLNSINVLSEQANSRKNQNWRKHPLKKREFALLEKILDSLNLKNQNKELVGVF